MADPVVSITNGVPTSGTGTITTLGQTLVDGANATLGITTGAAVTTNAAGTLQQYLRGIVSLLVSGITVASHAVTNAGTFAVQSTMQAGSAIVGKFGIDQTTDGTTNKVAADLRLAGVALDKGSGTGGTATPRVIIDSSQFSVLGATTKSASTSVARATDEALGLTVTQPASSTITRPADTTAYASGDLVANSVTAASVTNLQFTTLARLSGGSGVIIGAQIQKTSNVVTSAAFRLHLFNTAPTYATAGDNSALSAVVVASGKGYLGYIDITAMLGFSDVAWGSGAPDNTRGGIPYVATAQIIYGLLEARGAYTPISGEVFTVTVDALQD